VEIWILQVELNGEWEECSFPTKREALAAFSALTVDYRSCLGRAVLYAPQRIDQPEPGRHLLVN